MTLRIPLFALALATTGCAPSLLVQHDTAADLVRTDYRTYALLEPSVGDASLANDAVRPVIAAALDAKGFEAAAQGEADILVTYKVLTTLSGSDGLGNADPDRHEKTVLVVLQDADNWDILWVGWSFEEVEEPRLAERAEHAAREIAKTLPSRLD